MAEAIAGCITRGGGGPVFYDRYEKATLWGKDLYEHLSDVYRNQAEFCIIIASREHAEKIWTTHERKSAQSRALQEKGREYILPVDYDGTRIPGLLDTISYLNFGEEGVEGICKAFLEKIGTPGSRESIAFEPSPMTGSPRALLQAEGTLLWPPVVSSRWDSEILLVVKPDDPSDEPFLHGLRARDKPVVVAYQHNVAICKLEKKTHLTEASSSRWELKFQVQEDDFHPDMEMGTTGISAEQFAEQRARRLLLDENAAQDSEQVTVSVEALNEVSMEVLRRGLGTVAKIKRSPFPELYRQFGQNPTMFLEIAWITAVTFLKTSQCVRTVNLLKMELRSPRALSLEFVGTRHRKYQNVDPHVIRIAGDCPLDPPDTI